MKNNKIAYYLWALILVFNISYNLIIYNYPSFNLLYILPVVFAIGLAIFLFYFTKKFHNSNRYSYIFERNVYVYLVFYFLVIYLLGLVVGFMKNPLSYTPINIIINLFEMVVTKLVFESMRYNLLKINKSTLFCIIIVFSFSFFTSNIIGLISLTTPVAFFKYICKFTIPTLTASIIATYIAKNGSFKGLLLFQLVPTIVSTYALYQPDLNFFLSGTISIVFALIYYLVTKYQIDLKNPDLLKRSIKKSNPLSYIPYFAIFAIIISFVLGVFNYVPVAVMSNSMVPIYQRGDVIIYKKIDNVKTIQKGDIVCYRLNNILVMHRVVKIEKQKNKLVFTTKGDNLTHNDIKKVTEEQIVGIIKLTIPKCGYPSVWFYELLSK